MPGRAFTSAGLLQQYRLRFGNKDRVRGGHRFGCQHDQGKCQQPVYTVELSRLQSATCGHSVTPSFWMVPLVAITDEAQWTEMGCCCATILDPPVIRIKVNQ